MNVVWSSVQPQICQRAAAAAGSGRHHLCKGGQQQQQQQMKPMMRSSSSRRRRMVAVSAGGGGAGEDESSSKKKEEDDEEEEERRRRSSSSDELERLVQDEGGFSGADLAELIRSKYGRSYDVTLIQKEFMGRRLLAMNVMWKYREQRSFPLTEEEYLLRLDDVAASLRCWGAVSHVRSSLAALKDRPRIGKAVSIFIDMDQSGARSNEWIYK